METLKNSVTRKQREASERLNDIDSADYLAKDNGCWRYKQIT